MEKTTSPIVRASRRGCRITWSLKCRAEKPEKSPPCRYYPEASRFRRVEVGGDYVRHHHWRARQHNLKNVNVRIPRDLLTVGAQRPASYRWPSIRRRRRRRYVESSVYARQFSIRRQHIEGLSPAIAIEQRTSGGNPRSIAGHRHRDPRPPALALRQHRPGAPPPLRQNRFGSKAPSRSSTGCWPCRRGPSWCCSRRWCAGAKGGTKRCLLVRRARPRARGRQTFP